MESQKGLGRWDVKMKLKNTVFCLELSEYGREEFSEAVSISFCEQFLNLRVACDDGGQRKGPCFSMLCFRKKQPVEKKTFSFFFFFYEIML